MRLLFLGDMVGRTGRTAVWERLPGLISRLQARFRHRQWRERRRRLRHHRRDLSRDDRRRRRCGDHRQPCLGPARGAEVRAARGALPAAGQFPQGHAGRGCRRLSSPGTAPGCWSSNIMGRVFMHPELDDPFQAGRARAGRLPARRAGRCGGHRFPRRGDLGEDVLRAFRRRPRQPGRRHPHAPADRRPPDPEWRHRLSCPTPACAATTIPRSAWTRRSRSTGSCRRCRRAVSRRRPGRRRSAASASRFPTAPAWPRGSRRSGCGPRLEETAPSFWS